MDLATALRVLTDAMRPPTLVDAERRMVNANRMRRELFPNAHEEELPDDEPEDGDEDEREVSANSVPLPRPMGYFSQRPAKTTQQRAANTADPDAPLAPPRAVLLAPPDKKKRKEAA